MLKVDLFDKEMPRAIVVSHERSRTRLLMSALESAFGYVSDPWINFDNLQVNINFHHPPSVEQFFKTFDDVNLANPVKSHHAVEFFQEVLPAITRDFVIFYVYRDPRELMLSYWQYMHKWNWAEGPKAESCGAFIRSAPCGRMLRYQMHQYPNLLSRWQGHVTGWLTASESYPAIIPIRYESLDERYEDIVHDLAERLRIEIDGLENPSAANDAAAPNGHRGTTPESARFEEADLEFFESEIGATMLRLGYGEGFQPTTSDGRQATTGPAGPFS